MCKLIIKVCCLVNSQVDCPKGKENWQLKRNIQKEQAYQSCSVSSLETISEPSFVFTAWKMLLKAPRSLRSSSSSSYKFSNVSSYWWLGNDSKSTSLISSSFVWLSTKVVLFYCSLKISSMQRLVSSSQGDAVWLAELNLEETFAIADLIVRVPSENSDCLSVSSS